MSVAEFTREAYMECWQRWMKGWRCEPNLVLRSVGR